MDKIDFRIGEPSPSIEYCFSHKFKGAALRYEVAADMAGTIVWFYWPFAAGEWTDIKISKLCPAHNLDRGEKIVADGGYQHELCLSAHEKVAFIEWVRARH